MSHLCKPDRFKIYDFPPPRMFTGCMDFLVEHTDDIIDSWLGRKDNPSLENELCYEKINVY